jgi:hypothetical protein
MVEKMYHDLKSKGIDRNKLYPLDQAVQTAGRRSLPGGRGACRMRQRERAGSNHRAHHVKGASP